MARMLYGLYLSAQGARNQTLRLQTIANNVANADTTAFKRELAVFQDHLPFDAQQGNLTHPPGNLNRSTGGTTIATTQTDYTTGPLTRTGAPYDLAITGPGFFQVKQGSEKLLTRDGQLSINHLGEIVTQAKGLPVLNTQGTSIVVPPGVKQVNVGPAGNVLAVTSENEMIPLGQLNLVEPAAFKDLQKLGGNLYRGTGPLVPASSNAQIRQGFLEASGVHPISETVQMIEASRAFETNINMIHFQDESLSLLLQSMTKQ